MLFLVACAKPDTPPPRTEPDLASATAFVDSFIVSLAHPDAPGSVRLDTADFVWARSGALLSADSLGMLLAAQRSAKKTIVLGTNDAHLTPLGPQAVVWSGIVSGVVKDSLGKQQQVRGALTLVLRQDGNTWVIAAGHESVRPFDDVHEAAAAGPH
jgi:hypothetical protein